MKPITYYEGKDGAKVVGAIDFSNGEDMTAGTVVKTTTSGKVIVLTTKFYDASVGLCEAMGGLRTAIVKVAGGMHANKRLLHLAMHSKKRRVRKKNADRLLKCLAGYDFVEGVNT